MTTGVWLNSDGLAVKFPAAESVTGTAGEYRTNGMLREVEVTITLASLGTAAAILDQNVFLPVGARIQEIVILNKTAATGSGAVLNIGLQRMNQSTELDYDGLVAALALTAFDAAGEQVTINVGSTGAGALLGTTLTNVGYLTADYDTAAFTAGVIVVRVRWYAP